MARETNIYSGCHIIFAEYACVATPLKQVDSLTFISERL